ncbi:YigZ family protein [Enterococcus dongliensis]|uniref:YigZ family protein n=1 Tax=Enterococcus dongliensis TaxID=2559925 RepID=UPI00288DC16F|nr:YigZ family protein [Enterococcus dongliensis]MDT2612577.1 YigZ family protein [Enterococcus dongliensis]MDT2639103.1 YigZ family protein [Enterococcus dongliensis]MDT2673040.1 YigZ family protein [Enterococcus dongliensis]
MLQNYRTIKKDHQHEIEIKKSRFICFLKRITSEEEAKAFIQQIKKDHWKANHNCSAFVLGDRNEIQRSSDDGEPSGTAGVPMLEVLKKNDLINVCAVVTRYFGGTKLGAGGLIRAYSGAVSQAIAEIGIVEGRLQQEIFVQLDYPNWGKMENFLTNAQIAVKDTQFTDQVIVTCLVDENQRISFETQVTDLLNGQVHFETGEMMYHEQIQEA